MTHATSCIASQPMHIRPKSCQVRLQLSKYFPSMAHHPGALAIEFIQSCAKSFSWSINIPGLHIAYDHRIVYFTLLQQIRHTFKISAGYSLNDVDKRMLCYYLIEAEWPIEFCKIFLRNLALRFRLAPRSGAMSVSRNYRQAAVQRGTGTVYWCIASKLEVPLFLMEWTTRVCVLIYHFSISLILAVLQRQKSLPDMGDTTIQDVDCLTAMGLAMEPHVHTMSDELLLQIPGNIFLAFTWILMMRWGHNISHYTTAKQSVHVWNHDLIWWHNKIDTQKTFPQDYDYEL